MAVNRTKVLEAAQKFLSKGQYDKAVAEYQKLVAEDPRDVRTLLKIGDLHTRRHKPKDAIDVYERVADLYAKQGFFLKAVAVYKQILKLDPAHLDATQKLAKMYEELALTSDALSTYDLVADALMAQGQVGKALETMERMVELDGQNVAVRIKHAEALSKAGKAREAAQAFASGAQLLREQGRMDDYLRVVERQLYHDPENVLVARELAGLYLERSDPKRALAKLQACFKADPRDVQTLEMLAEAFRQLGQMAKTVSVLKEIARLHGEAGSEEPRRRTLERVLDLDPADAEAQQGLTRRGTIPKVTEAGAPAGPTAPPPRRPAPPPPPAAVKPPPPPLEETQEDEQEIELEAAEDIDLIEEPEAGDEVLIVDEPSEPDEPRTETGPDDQILALLADADAREGAGDYEGAVAALQQVLALNPDHMAAHERLKDIYVAADRRVDAVKELLWLSQACEEHSFDRALQYAEAARELAPRSDATRKRLVALGMLPAEEPHAAEPPRAARLEPTIPVARVTEPAAPEPASTVRLLDLPIHPDEFGAPPPRPRRALTADEISHLLELPLAPADFAEAVGMELPGGNDADRPAAAAAAEPPARAEPAPPRGPPSRSMPLPRSLPPLGRREQADRSVHSLERPSMPEPEPLDAEWPAAELTPDPGHDSMVPAALVPEPPAAPRPTPPESAAPRLQQSEPAREPSQSGPRAVVSGAPSEVSADVEEVLHEAEFFASQGLLDEALEVVQEAILIYPSSEALKRRLVEYEDLAEHRDAAEEDGGEQPAKDQSFDIAEQLAKEPVEVSPTAESDEMVDVESVFAQFKKGVAEQIAPDDSETHYDLGIAYKEMGLLGDAISEFELAARGKKRAVAALTMIGACQLERGDVRSAIGYFERALALEHQTPGEELALHYEIGNAYEQLGELDEALAAFERVAARERTFRGVGARLDQLKQRGVKSARAGR